MFYTAEMIHDVKVVWKAVVDRMFRGEEGMKLCVRDSTMHKSSISGGFRWSSGEVPDGEKDIDTNGAAKSGTVTLRKGSHWFMVICCIVGGALFW